MILTILKLVLILAGMALALYAYQINELVTRVRARSGLRRLNRRLDNLERDRVEWETAYHSVLLFAFVLVAAGALIFRWS